MDKYDMFCLTPTNPQEIEQIIKSFKNKNSSVYDGIPVTVVNGSNKQLSDI